MSDARLLAACLEELRAIRALLEGRVREERAQRHPLRPKASAMSPPDCPSCGLTMKMRHRHRDGAPFWGCRSFPECTGIVNIDEEDEVDEEPFTPSRTRPQPPDEPGDWEADAYDIDNIAMRWDHD